MNLRLTIARAMVLFGLVTTAGLAAVVFTGIYALSEVKVGGPLYDKLKLGNDLIADILPPPEYVIESYLEATLALNNAGDLARRRDRLAQLKKEYDERHAFWVTSDLDPSIKAKLVQDSHREVQRFWNAIEQGLLPALAKADTAAAAKSYAEITSAYLAHRHLIDEIVKKTTDDNAATETAATRRVATFTMMLWIISGAVFLIIGIGLAGVGLGVIRPMTGMTGVMARVAGGDLDIEIPSLNRADEVGAMARAVQVFRENSARVQAMEAEQADLKLKAEEERKATMGRVADGFEQAVGKIVEAVSSASLEIETAAGSLTRTADTSHKLTATAASASDSSSGSARSAATASEELASSVGEISRKVKQSEDITHAAVRQAEQTNDRITELSQAASRIGEVVQMIAAVAQQTNLLALNATIEAARAGEAGRGFAVVASEVKALATQTAKATDEIGTQITQMQSATQQSVAAIKAIGATIGEISEISTAIAASVEQQGAATQEIARNIQAAVQGTIEVAECLTKVNRGSADTSAAAEQVHGFSRSLSQQGSALKLEVGKFLEKVRAA
ncbi:HAMP domain-containing protein [Bradyrhizobium lablabi]|uniref:methyl-accepting chemotaxis protein n=1 Tax=Bradyrhizobium lablabi TaxID=722472 RepID=UPI001BAA9AF2|nr:HAMP domain-containing methyl-accepting chemotaxis protein [Bradyrhizobium lablabi]MBR1122878.1 HAMP domain-containing protein [Bradyrhizobium lablabi]